MDYTFKGYEVGETGTPETSELEPIGDWIARLFVWLVLAPLSAAISLLTIYLMIGRLVGF